MIDIVYVLGTGSKFNDNEMRLSIRSIEKFVPHRNIYVIGEKLDWFRKIIKVPVPDISKSKITNTQYKLKVACDIPELSETFLLMNDDFFILKPYTYRPEHRGLLSERIKQHPTKGCYYYQALLDTKNYLKRGAKDYSLHKPMLMEKSKLKAILSQIEGKELLTRTVYGNTYNVGGEKVDDVKLTDIQELDKYIGSDVVSTTDMSVRRREFITFMYPLFNKKTIYEKYDIQVYTTG